MSVCVFACGFCRAQFLINLFISSQKAQRLNVCLTRAPHRHAPRPLLCLPPLCEDLANLSINCRRVFSLFCTRHWPWTLPNPPREAKTEWNFLLYLKSFFFRLISWTRLVQLPESFFLFARRMNLLCLDNFYFILIVNVLVFHIVRSIWWSFIREYSRSFTHLIDVHNPQRSTSHSFLALSLIAPFCAPFWV